MIRNDSHSGDVHGHALSPGSSTKGCNPITHSGPGAIGSSTNDDTSGVITMHGPSRQPTGEGHLTTVERDVPHLKNELIKSRNRLSSGAEPQGAGGVGIDNERTHVEDSSPGR